jgi:hypothetical protein
VKSIASHCDGANRFEMALSERPALEVVAKRGEGHQLALNLRID